LIVAKAGNDLEYRTILSVGFNNRRSEGSKLMYSFMKGNNNHGPWAEEVFFPAEIIANTSS
jgi:hypothetical protein